MLSMAHQGHRNSWFENHRGKLYPCQVKMVEFGEELCPVSKTKDGANTVVVVTSDWEGRESNLSHFSLLTSLVTRIFSDSEKEFTEFLTCSTRMNQTYSK